ncbi:MAG: RNA polymerase sigma factor [Phycisphaerales bacterium]|nr:RNA polymerase sigma factor [Phycisphaerales bacterium]
MPDQPEPSVGAQPNAAAARREIALHVDAVRARVRQRLRRDAEVDDLVQQTLARALVSASAIRELGAVRPWLLTIAERVVVDHLRATGKRARCVMLPSLDEHRDPSAPSADCTLEDLEFWEVVGRSFERMPDDLREVGRRHFLVGDSLKAIADALDRSKSTIQSQVERVRDALAARLQQSGARRSSPARSHPGERGRVGRGESRRPGRSAHRRAPCRRGGHPRGRWCVGGGDGVGRGCDGLRRCREQPAGFA